LEILIFLLVVVVMGISAAALGGVYAIYASRQD
jgi:hypothetical protein